MFLSVSLEIILSQGHYFDCFVLFLLVCCNDHKQTVLSLVLQNMLDPVIYSKMNIDNSTEAMGLHGNTCAMMCQQGCMI